MEIRYVTEPNKARKAVDWLIQHHWLGVDCETTGLDPYTSRVRLLQVAVITGVVLIFDLDKIPADILKPLSAVPWATFNGQFEYQHLYRIGIEPPRMHDLMLMDRLATHEIHNLGQVTGIDKTEQLSDWALPELSEAQLQYAAIDPLVTIRKSFELLPKIPRAVYDLWRDVIPVLAKSTLSGQSFNWSGHADLVSDWEKEKHNLLHSLDTHMPNVNPNSGQQIGEWLKDNLDSTVLDNWPKTDTGRLSTNSSTLTLFGNLPAIAPLLQYKKVQKLINTYGKGYNKHKHILTSNLHPQYQIGRTRTGRLACSNPNTQQVPSSSDFRSLFIAPPGMTLVSADFSQIELRVAALLSGDLNMIDSYAAGIDLHAKTAASVAGIPIKSVTPSQRQAAKPVNFGVLYGQQPPSLVQTAKTSYGVDMTEDEARMALLHFGKAYPQLNRWQRDMREQARETGQVSSKSGLVRDFHVQGGGYINGEAVNMPVQATAAEVLLASLNRLMRPLYGTVHDEVTIFVPEEDAEAAAHELEAAMVEGFMQIFSNGEKLLKGLVEVKTGGNWSEVH
ncbi:DNA polymerase [Gammaproteobacteria bacterium]|nr:DNA polymerase [Gammaproteobacteria bacterium]